MKRLAQLQLSTSVQKRLPSLCAVIFVLLTVGFVFWTQSARSTVPDHGDFWSDAHILINIRGFIRYGFQTMRYSLSYGHSPSYPQPYVNHPPFMYLVLGQLAQWGLDEIQLRLFPLVISSSSGLAMYLMVKKVVNPAAAITTLALALCAPAFRYVADAYVYNSYDFAFKSWAILCITLANMQPRRRLIYTIAGATIGAAGLLLSSWETCMTIGLYAILSPIVLSLGNWRERSLRALLSGSIVGSLMIAAVATRLAFNTWVLGDWQSAINVWYRGASSRIHLTTTCWGRKYLPELLYRIWSYYPIHLLLIGAAGLVAFLDTSHKTDFRPGKVIKWLCIILASELAWFALFRQHSSMHIHTLNHLFLTLSVAAGVSIDLLTKRVVAWFHWTTARQNILLAGFILIVCSLLLLNTGVAPYGNLQKKLDLSQELERGQFLQAVIPPNSLVFVYWNNSPLPLLLMDREYVSWRRFELPETILDEDAYLLVPDKPENPLFDSAMQDARLVEKGYGVAVFHLNPSSFQNK